MTKAQFWPLYLPVLAILFGLYILSGILFDLGRSAWRRWRCRREMQTIRVRTPTLKLIARILEKDSHSRRRAELENLATARDKAERKIH